MSSHDHSCETVSSMEHFTSTELIVREDILSKAQELAQLLTTSDEVHLYQQAEKQVNTHDEVQSLISIIKKKQKEIVAFESFKNEKMVLKIESEIEVLQDQLDSFPIVTQFRQSQEDINYLLQLVISVIRDKVSEKINVEAGTAVPPTQCD